MIKHANSAFDGLYSRRLLSFRNEKTVYDLNDETAILFDTIIFSAGRIGAQIETSLAGLQQVIPVQAVDLVVDE